MRIRCVQCERGHFGPVEASKVRTPAGWSNVCAFCGTAYPAPPPALAYHRLHQRRLRRRQARAEAYGQLRLFPR